MTSIPGSNELTPEQIVKYHDAPFKIRERISHRQVIPPIEIVEPNPDWSLQYQEAKNKIQDALGPNLVSIDHVGSTSVPTLPAKPLIDIDLVVADIEDEPAYVPALEAAGFQFLTREPAWHSHRFFCGYDPVINLHIWGPGCPEVARHVLLRDWLREHKDDCEAYAKIKREAAEATHKSGGDLFDYNARKDPFIRELMDKIFRAKGYVS